MKLLYFYTKHLVILQTISPSPFFMSGLISSRIVEITRTEKEKISISRIRWNERRSTEWKLVGMVWYDMTWYDMMWDEHDMGYGRWEVGGADRVKKARFEKEKEYDMTWYGVIDGRSEVEKWVWKKDLRSRRVWEEARERRREKRKQAMTWYY